MVKTPQGQNIFFSCPLFLSFITWSTLNGDKICCSDPRHVEDKVEDEITHFPCLCITSSHFLTFLGFSPHIFQTLP